MDGVGLPFHPDDPSFNRANALYLAYASDIAYDRAPAVAAWERLGLKALAFRNKVTRTRGFIGICDTHAVLSFRGSDPLTLQAWVTDAFAGLVERAEYEGRVHLGFSSVLKRTWKSLEVLLETAEDKPLFITGHSMGGALAVLTGCRIAKRGRPPAAIYTYGSPRVGDLAFCAGYALPTYRVVNRLDLVPELPLPSIRKLLPAKARNAGKKIGAKLKRFAERAPSYGHVKTFVYIDRDGQVITDADVEPWHTAAVARAIATRGKSFHEGLTDHMITSYIRGLEGQAGINHVVVRRRIRTN